MRYHPSPPSRGEGVTMCGSSHSLISPIHVSRCPARARRAIQAASDPDAHIAAAGDFPDGGRAIERLTNFTMRLARKTVSAR